MKRLHDRIKTNISHRGGEELPIERRMLASIQRTVKKSGISLSELSTTEPKNWGGKNLFERAKCVGLDTEYLAAFGGGSHSVHGNWMDLIEYHLEDDEEGFGPQLEWRHPRPQICLAIALMTVDTIRSYFQYVGGDEMPALLEDRLEDISKRILVADRAHERFISVSSKD